MSSLRQLALPFPHVPRYAAADFVAADSNAAALAWLGRGDWPERRLALWGAAGCGKTHLLHLWAARAAATVLDGPALRGLPPPVGALAIDDADAVPDEPALLHLLNAAAEARQAVLLTGRTAPSRWPLRLPDLASRLRAVTAVPVGAPEDALLRALLARLLAERQLAVPEQVQDWLRLRLPRTAAAVREAVARLDRLALASGSAVSRPLAATVLAGLQEPGEDESEAAVAYASPFGPALL